MRPPRLARALLRAIAPASHRDAIADDLDEAFAREPAAGAWWYWRQVLRGAPAIARLHVRERRTRVRGAGRARRFVLDLQYAVRALRRTPGFTLVALASLSVGIGASTALYGAIRVTVLDALDVNRASELRLVYWAGPDTLRVSQYNSDQYRAAESDRPYRSNVSFEVMRALVAHAPGRVFGFNFIAGLTADGDGVSPVSASGLIVTGNGFEVLGVPMTIGRGIGRDDDTASAEPVVVLTHRFWTSSLAGDPRVLGRMLRINGYPHEVIGVTAPSFSGLSVGGRLTPAADVIVPVSDYVRVWPIIEQERLARGGLASVLWLRTMMRVPEGEAASAEMAANVLRGALRESGVVTGSEAAGLSVLLRPGARGVDATSSTATGPLRVLSAVVAVVLLIACVNLAALMLARNVARQRELAVRQALGAGRAGLIRQLLAEGLVLAMAGGVAGVGLAMLARPLVEGMVQAGLGVDGARLPLDWRTFLIAAAVSAATVVVFGLLPAVRTTSGGLVDRLRQHMIGAAAPRQRLGRALLAVQIAITVPLIFGAMLMLRTLGNLDRVETGFQPDGLVIFRLNAAHALASEIPPGGTLEPARLGVFVRRLLDRVEAIPGVTSATVVENALLSGFTSDNQATIDGREVSMFANGIGPRFFETFGLPLVAGQAPALDDGLRPVSLVVINQTAARRHFGEDAPLGRRFRFGTRDVEVIGVAGDSRYGGLRSSVPPTVFDPYLQRARGRREITVAVRTAAPGLAIEAGIREAVRDVAPATPVLGLRTQREQIALLSTRERLLARLLALFGMFALGLACVGLHGATAYAVARRTSEIGLRMALGARREQVGWMVLRSVLVLTLIGVAAGLAIAIAAGRSIAAFLFELSPGDPATLGAAAALMAAAALAAGVVPAARASRIEPLVALRRD